MITKKIPAEPPVDATLFAKAVGGLCDAVLAFTAIQAADSLENTDRIAKHMEEELCATLVELQEEARATLREDS